MEMISPNITAVIVMALISLGIGWLWYRKLFCNMIVCSHPHNEETKPCCLKCYIVEFILLCIMGYVLSMFVMAMNADTIMTGLKVGFWAWLGFIGTTMYSRVVWCCKSMKNFYIGAGYYLVILMIMGAAFAVWR
ncbi:MAG: DUF1761 domain-containing protein [Verrucomicrobia bacterium]|nr:DUF1761 domain-containing protein [Verrucomicrobiota bacterium]